MGAEQPFEPGQPNGVARPSARYYTIRNPFDNWTSAEMEQEAISFAKMAGLERYQDEFVRGGKLNLDPDAYTRTEDSPSLGLRIAASEEEIKALQLERSSKHGFSRFNQSSGLLKLVILCSAAAAGRLACVSFGKPR